MCVELSKKFKKQIPNFLYDRFQFRYKYQEYFIIDSKIYFRYCKHDANLSNESNNNIDLTFDQLYQILNNDFSLSSLMCYKHLRDFPLYLEEDSKNIFQLTMFLIEQENNTRQQISNLLESFQNDVHLKIDNLKKSFDITWKEVQENMDISPMFLDVDNNISLKSILLTTIQAVSKICQNEEQKKQKIQKLEAKVEKLESMIQGNKEKKR